jgi:hypothetical protein
MAAHNFIDLTGQRFGRWTVLSISGKNLVGQLYWDVLCDCGEHRTVAGHALRYRQTQSCGCLSRECIKTRSVTHGKSGSIEHNRWKTMKNRCFSPNNKQYADYGGRGITICERWLHSFENFLADIGPCPGPGYTIDRIDNDGSYTPDNCRWATRIEQCNNTRKNRMLTFQGKTLTLAQASHQYKISYCTLRQRLSTLGWSVERALTEPVHRQAGPPLK